MRLDRLVQHQIDLQGTRILHLAASGFLYRTRTTPNSKRLLPITFAQRIYRRGWIWWRTEATSFGWTDICKKSSPITGNPVITASCGRRPSHFSLVGLLHKMSFGKVSCIVNLTSCISWVTLPATNYRSVAILTILDLVFGPGFGNSQERKGKKALTRTEGTVQLLDYASKQQYIQGIFFSSNHANLFYTQGALSAESGDGREAWEKIILHCAKAPRDYFICFFNFKIFKISCWHAGPRLSVESPIE